MIALIVGFAVLLLIVAIALVQRSGPRVTQVETKKIDRTDEGEEG